MKLRGGFIARTRRVALVAAVSCGWLLAPSVASALMRTTFSPYSLSQPYAGQTVTITVSDDGVYPPPPNPYITSGPYQVVVYVEAPGNSGSCAATSADEAARNPATVIPTQTVVPAAWTVSGTFNPATAGDYLICSYVNNSMGKVTIMSPVPLPVQTPPAGAPGSTGTVNLWTHAPPDSVLMAFHVVNQRGIGQYSQATIPGVGSAQSNGQGLVAVPVKPGEVVQFTRSTLTGSCAPPEGPYGVTYTVPTTAPQNVTITLPDATGPAFHPELSPAERWVIGKINQLRPASAQLHISSTLTASADAVAHRLALIRASKGSYPFPPQYCSVLAQDWGWPRDNFGLEDAATTSAQAALAHWTDSSARGQNTRNSQWTDVGIADGNGAWILELGTCPLSDATARPGCHTTTDTGDPNANPNGRGAAANGNPTPAGTSGKKHRKKPRKKQHKKPHGHP